jgi:hypothetical protein
MIRWKSVPALVAVVLSALILSGCDSDSVRVYGNVSVGNSWGSYHGSGHRPHINTSINISGRIL